VVGKTPPASAAGRVTGDAQEPIFRGSSAGVTADGHIINPSAAGASGWKRQRVDSHYPSGTYMVVGLFRNFALVALCFAPRTAEIFKIRLRRSSC
jgi:hypothetical protein